MQRSRTAAACQGGHRMTAAVDGPSAWVNPSTEVADYRWRRWPFGFSYRKTFLAFLRVKRQLILVRFWLL